MIVSGAKIGRNCRIYDSFYLLVKKGGSFQVGDNFHVLSSNYFNPLVRGNKTSLYVRSGASLMIGSNSGISSSCIFCTKNITIGNHVQIGANSLIMDSDAHYIDFKKRRESASDIGYSKDIIISNDVLIGANSIVLKGVTIGERSVIGAGSVVTKSIPADCIAAGNPCRVIRYINNEG